MSEAIRKAIFDLVDEYWAARHAPRPFRPGVDLVHYAGRVFDAHEIAAAVDASLEFFLTAGRFAAEFEREFAARLGRSHALLVNSGSSAVLLSITALTSPKLGSRRLRPGDEVVTVAAAFPTTVAPIVQNGLVPVFVDVSLGDYAPLPDRLAAAIGPKTRAIILAHTLGIPFNLDQVMDLVRRHHLWLVEDNCDALGSRYRGRLTGTFGHLATASFYPAHHITMGEGGCVVTDEERLARVALSLRDWGRDCYCGSGHSNTCGRRFSQRFGRLPMGYDHKYVYSHLGYNLKTTDLQAAIGCVQLRKLDRFIAARRRNFRRLYARLAPYAERFVLPTAGPHAEPSWFAFPLTVRRGAGFTRNELTRHLEEHKIETRNLFSGNLLRHPAFMGVRCRVVGDLRNTDCVTTSTFFVGVYPGLTNAHIDYMADVFDDFIRRHARRGARRRTPRGGR